MYEIPYEAEFECEKGHTFTARVNPTASASEQTCPHCYAEWIDKNIPKGKQKTKPVAVSASAKLTFD